MQNVSFQPFEHTGWQGYVCPQGQRFVGGADLISHSLQNEHYTIRGRSGADVYRIENRGTPANPLPPGVSPESQTVYLKHYKDQTTRASKIDKQLAESPAIFALTIAERMREKGILAPQILLAARKIQGKQAQDVFIVARVEGQSLIELLMDAKQNDRRRLLKMAGNELAHFHNAGFVHGECMPNNTYVTPDKTRLVFFDNDRIMHNQGNYLDNLEQLIHNLICVVGYDSTLDLMDTYDNTRQFHDPAERQRRWEKIFKNIAKRIKQEYPWPKLQTVPSTPLT